MNNPQTPAERRAAAKEQRLLDKLEKLNARRDYHVWRLGDVDRQITKETQVLAAHRGCTFIRPETIRAELAARRGAAA